MTPRQRFAVMIAATCAALLVALAAIVAHVSFGQAWGLPLFVIAILGGFGAQIGFVVGLMKASAPHKEA